MRSALCVGFAVFLVGCSDASSSSSNPPDFAGLSVAEQVFADVTVAASKTPDTFSLSDAANCALVTGEVREGGSDDIPIKYPDGSSLTKTDLAQHYWLEIASLHGFDGSVEDLSRRSRYFEALHGKGSLSVRQIGLHNPRALKDFEVCISQLNSAPRPSREASQ